MQFRADVNALRAVAVALVVLFHYDVPGFDGGFVGVDIFFVISGYLMTRIIAEGLERQRFSYLKFIAARAARIWPALGALILVLLALGAVALPPMDYDALARQAASAALFDSNRFFRDGEGYFTSGPDERWLLHTWSLSVEWQFYLLYPAYLGVAHAAARRLPSRWAISPRRMLGWAIAALFAISLLYCAYQTSRLPKSAFFMLPSRAWQMAAGGLVLMAEPRVIAFTRRWGGLLQLLGLLLLAVVLVAAMNGSWERRWPGALATLPVLASMVFLLAGAPPDSEPARWLRWEPIQAIGRWSYSVYLWHWPVAVALHILQLDAQHAPVAAASGIALSVILGWLSYRWIESAFKGSISVATLRRMVVLPALALLVSAVAAWGVAETDGWIQRVGSERYLYAAYQSATAIHPDAGRCYNFRAPREKIQLCSINPSQHGPRVLVYGDSHAGHLYPWFEKNATVGVDVLVSAGCPIVPGHNRIEPGFFCDDFWAHVAQVASSPLYDTIVISGRWAGFDEVPLDICQSRANHCVQHSTRSHTMNENEKEWKRLLALGKTLVIVDGTPEPGYDVPKTASRRRFWHLPVKAEFETPASGGPSRYIDELLARFAAEPRLQRVSLRRLICPDKQCLALDPHTGQPLFGDSNHLAVDWIKEHADVLLPYVQPRQPQYAGP